MEPRICISVKHLGSFKAHQNAEPLAKVISDLTKTHSSLKDRQKGREVGKEERKEARKKKNRKTSKYRNQDGKGSQGPLGRALQ